MGIILSSDSDPAHSWVTEEGKEEAFLAYAGNGRKQEGEERKLSSCLAPVTKIPHEQNECSVSQWVMPPRIQHSLFACGFSQSYFPPFNNIHCIDSNLQGFKFCIIFHLNKIYKNFFLLLWDHVQETPEVSNTLIN